VDIPSAEPGNHRDGPCSPSSFFGTEFFFALNLTNRNAFTLPTIFRAFLGFQASQYGEASALAVTCPVPSIACWSSATSCVA
jgi:hypothetical protein